MSINIFNILIICGVVQGFIFSFIILKTKKINIKSYKFLVYLVLTISLSNLFYWFKDIGLASEWQFYELFYVPLDLLILPFFYYFVCSYLDIKNKLGKYLLTPFFARLGFQLIIIVYTFLAKPIYIFPKPYEVVLLKLDEYGTILFMFICIFLIITTIFKYENQTKPTIVKSTKWLKQLVYYGIALCVIWICISVFNDIIPEVLNFRKKYYFIWIGLSVLIYWLGYSGIYYLGVFNESNELRTRLTLEKIQPNKELFGNVDRFNEIDNKIKTERLYTNSSINLFSISQLFNLSENYVSQLINSHTNTNFSTYINNLRVEKTKQILANKNYDHYTILAIALEAGFNSKSTFYTAFKKHTGVLPSQYRKQKEVGIISLFVLIS